jgi:hypothetical protein
MMDILVWRNATTNNRSPMTERTTESYGSETFMPVEVPDRHAMKAGNRRSVRD